MAAATSPATGQAYGVKRVCTIWGVARSSFYDSRHQDARPPGRPAGRPGPKPALSDAELLAAIRRDLARSPWTGEGHRKVWARLRVIDGIRVSRTRVLRIMGENSLLSPHRRPPRPANDHDGSITTEAPNVMWGADGAVIPTVEDGNVTLFIVAEHWNAEGLGWHVAKHGNRYAAAEALALMGVVVIKLFVIDLRHVDRLEGIVAKGARGFGVVACAFRRDSLGRARGRCRGPRCTPRASGSAALPAAAAAPLR